MCLHTNEQEPEAHDQNKENRTIRFQEPDPTVLSRLVVVMGAIELR
jgi:hypothetical protein